MQQNASDRMSLIERPQRRFKVAHPLKWA